jgi:RNA polymerase sigma-70 factor (sigma-E family)
MGSSTDFVEFVTARSHRLLRAAYLLTRDHALAEDLLQTALARSWPVWHRIDGDPEPYVRRVLVNTHNSWWRRRWNFERPTAEPPDRDATSPHTEVDDRDEVWQALSRLPKQQRAVLVLRYFEDMTEAQIAHTLDISPGGVKSYAAKGLAKLRVDPTLADEDRLDGVYRKIEGRRRKIITIGAAIVVVVVLLVGYLLSPILHRKALPPVEDPGFPEYLRGYHVVYQQPGATGRLAPKLLPPPPAGSVLLARCTGYGRQHHISVDLSVNGGVVAKANCADQATPDEPVIASIDSELARQTGVIQGGRAMYWITVSDPLSVVAVPFNSSFAPVPRETAPPPPDSGVLAVGYAEAVPFESYPLPRRPARLVELDRDLSGYFAEPAAVLEANGPHTVTLPWEGRYPRLYANSQTPGTLRISLNGQVLDSATWWDYRAADHRSMPALPTGFTEPPIGTPVTITVDALHTTGDWFVMVA